MPATVSIAAEALRDIERYFERAPEIVPQAARMAINDVASGKGLTMLRTGIAKQVAFPAGYLREEDKLGLRKRATDSDLEARIGARARPTSLARFAGGGTPESSRRTGVTVTVKPGSPKKMRQAFLVRLKSGASLTEDRYNLGLAIRLKDGDRVINKRKQNQVQLSHNVYLLYGPSVEQVFRDVAAESTEDILAMTDEQFLRQFIRLSEKA